MEKLEYIKMYRSQQTHWWYVTRRVFIQTFLKRLPSGKNKKILDVGCGTGANTSVLRLFGNVTGIDISPHAKKLYTTNTNALFHIGSAMDIPCMNNHFDVVAVCDVLYHKNIKSPQGALRETYRVLKPGGYCLITDCVHPFLFGIHDVKNQARERFTKQKLEELVRKSGYTIVRSSYSFMMTFPLFVFVRLLDKLRPQSSVSIEENISPPIHSLLCRLGFIESRLLHRINLPFGSSVILLAKKE